MPRTRVTANGGDGMMRLWIDDVDELEEELSRDQTSDEHDLSRTETCQSVLGVYAFSMQPTCFRSGETQWTNGQYPTTGSRTVRLPNFEGGIKPSVTIQ